MPFVVTGNGQNGPVRREHATAQQAVVDAEALMEAGASDVRLQDPTGEIYGPAELHLLYFARGRLDTR